MNWPRKSFEQIKEIVFRRLGENMNYKHFPVMGVPGSYLDKETFYDDAPFLKEAPFVSTLIANPNHIGCHTLEEKSEVFFKGTQRLERELISLVSEEIFRAEPKSIDGYVAPGGTEANIQAMWCYRNYYQKEFGANPQEICLIYSQDSHYSMPKAANLLALDQEIIKVNPESRKWDLEDLAQKVSNRKTTGTKYFIVIANCSTTMFGSVDDLDAICDFFTRENLTFKLHIDAAYGGFIYPFTDEESQYHFKNPHITSMTIDGHKMLQAPYGTGLFLVRKGFIQYCKTEEASYVQGKDYTICGSRSGANAISMWMILHLHGSQGWKMNMEKLIQRSDDICNRLEKRGVEFFRNPHINIITMKAQYIPKEVAEKNFLVSDNHENPNWYKIVVMPHVKRGMIDQFFIDLDNFRK
ncbi:MAG: aminotransferase class I/II-fold pyridoxal phosphate-dependent enzyme [Flavobacteriales bacterium]|jgi:glutamate/tyrosine decarboxylase-like PLP-dependent enzyme|nr:aminotransferase class I/II-fold pyridoxal phosphate-dependent enzyme [Flavobacteriales bacterium]